MGLSWVPGKKELKCSSRKQKAPEEAQQHWGITTLTLSGWKQPQVLCSCSQAGVGQPAPSECSHWHQVLGMRSVAQGCRNSQLHLCRAVPATLLKGAKVPSPVALQHYPAQEAQSSTCERDSQSAKHKVTVLLQLYALQNFNSEVTRIPFISPNLPSPEKQPTPNRNHYSSKSPTTDGFKECAAILVTLLTGQAKCSSDPSPLSSSQVDQTHPAQLSPRKLRQVPA